MSKKYYFSSDRPSSQNKGTVMNPFTSLSAIGNLELEEGDMLLLRRGSVFKGGYIHLHNTDGIMISSYATGPKPVVDAMGKGVWLQDYGCPLDNPGHRWKAEVSSTVLIFDCNDIRIKDIEVRNSGVDREHYSDALRMPRTGIAVTARNRGTVRNISIERVYVRNVEGNVYDKHLSNGGIYFTALKPDENNPLIPRFDFVRIRGCFLKNVSRWGIAVGYTYLWEKFSGTETTEEVFRKYGNTDIRITSSYVKDAGGDAITVMYALKPLVLDCRSDGAARDMNDRIYTEPLERKGKVAAAIWPWKCLDARFEYNEVYDTRLNQDGMAYDADSGWGTVYRHNYSRSNEGGAVMFCLEEAIGSVYKENVSDDDLGGVLSPSGCPDGIVRNNKIYRRESTPLMRRRMSDGKITLCDNEEIIIERKR
jgi:hypothetical protein